ncbi:polysaccharide biosynthesis C-terminal domain-containing protein [Cytobacillus oceanisediminis]|uniref:Uncharacterized protein n=1 Tax=Cytobacillus oceanisediminis 2691 TaxID=1196031 RepID=A0A160MGV6_9BACI|nr:polysaccharide biosynthesis C-terminal domain-containing protein [Cytobacillus oceanisediminis]AND42263.1 hypothetical protein A361_24970 [Cytobacillus oceanisediminis 2691]
MFSRLMSNPLLNKVGVYFFGNVLVAVITFFLVPIYSKALSTAEFGKIALLTIFIQIGSIIIKLGLETSFTAKFFKSNESKRTSILYTIFIIYLFFITFLLAVVALTDVYWINVVVGIDMQKVSIFKLLGIISFAVFAEFIINLLRLEQKALIYVTFSVSLTISKVLLIIYYIVVLNQGYTGFLDAYFYSYLIFFIISIIYSLKNYYISDFKFEKEVAFNLVKIGIPMVPGMIFSLVLTSGDQYILKYFGMMSAVGIYAMGYKFADAFSKFVIVPYRYAVIPIVMKKGNDSDTEFKGFLKRVIENFISIVFLLVLFLYSFFYQIYNLIIDPKFSEGFNIIWIIILSLIIWGIANMLGSTIILKEQTHKTLYLIMTAAILNIGLNLLFIPKYEIYGAAYATLISYTIVSILYYVVSQRLIKVSYNFNRIGVVITIFGIAFILQNLIDKMPLSPIVLILIKVIVFILSALFFIKLNLLDLNVLRNKSTKEVEDL